MTVAGISIGPDIGSNAGLTQLSSPDVYWRLFPHAVWFSSHLLCFEHFLSSSSKSPLHPCVHNARLTEAVNI
jgi:hypothetical protein